MKNSITEFHIDGNDMNEGIMSLLEILKTANYPVNVDTIPVQNADEIVWVITVKSSELALSVLRILQPMKVPFAQMTKKDENNEFYDYTKLHNQ